MDACLNPQCFGEAEAGGLPGISLVNQPGLLGKVPGHWENLSLKNKKVKWNLELVTPMMSSDLYTQRHLFACAQPHTCAHTHTHTHTHTPGLCLQMMKIRISSHWIIVSVRMGNFHCGCMSIELIFRN